MNLMPTVVLLTSVTASLVLPALNLFGVGGAKNSALLGRYGFSIGMRYFMWIGALAFTFLPLVFTYFGVRLGVGDWMVSLAITLFMVLCGFYTEMYKVKLTDTSITYGAFNKKTLMFNDVTNARIVTSGRGSVFFVLTYAKNKRVSLDGNIQYFDDLVLKLRSRLKLINPSSLDVVD